jgi:uncharacterized protein (DUF736 family)
MATIGTFTKQDGSFAGSLTTLTVKAKVTISPIEKTSEKAPDFRVYAGNAEIGAAWSATSKEGKAYLSVKLDDPSFASPILARLVEMEKGHTLVWTRQ